MIALVQRPSSIVTIEQAIEAIRYFRQAKSSIELRAFLQQIESEDEVYRLIRLLDSGMMFDYGTFIAQRAHARFNSARTFTWLCHALLERGRPFKVERMIAARLASFDHENGSVEDLNKIRKMQLTTLCMLNRIPEAEQIKKEIEEEGGHLAADQLASYLLHIQDYARAEEVLCEGLDLAFCERGDLARLSYATLLSNRGEHSKAISLLEDGQKKFQDYPAFHINCVFYHYHENNLEKVINEIPMINESNPYHVGGHYFIYIQAQSLYRLERWDEFAHWVEKHRQELGNSIFGELEIKRELAYNDILLNPIKQKVNYCVPASVSMILDVYDVEKTQDEIAEHVFEATGSKISTTVSYMKSLGFESKLFKGSIDRFKKIIDEGIPILLDFFIENGSHVQIVKGYDDRIGVLIIQDPNSLHPYYVRYDKFDTIYKLKDKFSIIFIPDEKVEIMSEIPEEEHVFFSEILQHLDWAEENKEEGIDGILTCFEEYQEEVYPAVLGLTILQGERGKPHLERWRNHLLTEFSAEDPEVRLVVANSYMRHGDNDKFQEMMNEVKEQTAYTQFLIGLSAYKNDDYSKAISSFERSIELDPFQPLAFAYLANCFQDCGYVHRALNFAESAIWQDESNEYIRSGYASILFELDQTDKALEIYTLLFQEDHSNQAYYAYEIGRCHRQNDNDEKSKEWFTLAKDINPFISFPYVRIAEIHMDSEQWQAAEDILLEGVTDKVPSEDCCILWQYIGYNRRNREQYKEAEQAFDEATTRDVGGNNLSVVYKAQSIIQQGEWERATHVISDYNAQFGLPEVLIRAGAMMLEAHEATTDEQINRAIEFMEEGLQSITEDIVSYVRMYVDYLEGTDATERALEQVTSLRVKWNLADIYCYEAILREQLGQYEEVEKLLMEAAILEPTNTFPHYRLGHLYKTLEDTERSIHHFLVCLECDEEFEGARDELVSIYAANEQFEEAKRYALELVQSCPILCNVQQLVEWLNGDEKEQLLTRIIELEGTIDEEWRLLGLTELIDINEAVTLLETEESPKLKRQYASLLNRKREYKKSFEVLKELLLEFPEDETLSKLWAEAVYKLKKHQRITFTIQKMDLSNEDKSSICRNLAKAFFPYINEFMTQRVEGETWLQRKKGLFKQTPLVVAVDDLFRAAYKYEPENFVSYLVYGEFFYEHGDYLKAYHELYRYLSSYEDEDVRQLAGLAIVKYGIEYNKPKYIKKALKEFEILADTAPHYYYAWKWIADSHYCLQNFESALQFYEKSITIDAENPEAYVGILMTNYDNGLFDEVVSMFHAFESSQQSTIITAMEESYFDLQYLIDFLADSVEETV